MARTVIKNIDWIVTVDEQRRVILDGSILVENDRIIAIGKTADIEWPDDAEVIDGSGLIATPGFIDTNVATVHQLGRGLADRCDIAEFRLKRVMVYEASLTSEDALAASRACQIEMIRSGTTCFVEAGTRFPDAVAAAAAETGMRAVIARSAQDEYDTPMGSIPSGFKREPIEVALREAEATIEAIKSDHSGRLTPGLSIPWIPACSDGLCRDIAALARAKRVGIVVSAAASRADDMAARVHHGKTDVARLANVGILGPRTIVAHAGWTKPRDILTLCESGASIACCPSASLRMGTGAVEHGRHMELMEFGANVAFGSGSAMASNHVDLLRQLYLFIGANAARRLDRTMMLAETAVEMGTRNGAAAVGQEFEIGSIEVGKKADISFFAWLATDWVPVINPISNLVRSARSGAHSVMVNGQFVLKAGEFTNTDEEAILKEVQVRAERIAERSGLTETCGTPWPTN